MTQRILKWLIDAGEKILKNIGQSFWNELWSAVLTGVQNAEIQYHSGAFKRDKVIESALAFVSERVRLNWLQKKLVALFIGYIIDQAITAVNDSLGKDWVTKANQVKEQLEKILPFLE